MKTSNNSDQAIVLLRIAEALEKIAKALEGNTPTKPKKETPFPWQEMSRKTRLRVQQHVIKSKDSNYATVFDSLEWPLTCESLVAAGPYEIGKANLIGQKSIDEIRLKLKDLGFEF
jgi:hypothetical protein